MNRFVALYDALDATTSTNAKVGAMVDYFGAAPAADAAWALYFLTGRKPKRLLGSGPLRAWAADEAGLPTWLFEESYAVVGDLAETIALVLDAARPARDADDLSLARWVRERVLPLRDLDPDAQRAAVVGWWNSLDLRGVYVVTKLITGSLRVGVSETLVVRAIARVAGLTPAVVAHRLAGTWEPTPAFFEALIGHDDGGADVSRPYPFFLAAQLEGGVESLGPPAEWLVEWKWDGIRAQLVRRAGSTFLWSRGEELITERFPEVAGAGEGLPDGTVLDGEVLAFGDGRPLPFAALQTRIARKTLTAKVLAAAPAAFIVYDLLEQGGVDVRERPLAERRALLAGLVREGGGAMSISPAVEGESWEDLTARRLEARGRGVEGLMLKRLDSTYGVGRKRGPWWKWKVDPYTIDAVLVYAQAGHGRRANLFTDYTFAVWQDGALVPVAKAYSGLTDEEIVDLDKWVRAHTREKFGPVRAVDPVHVFELAFEGIQASPRHKSGVAFRFPRVARWRTDKAPSDADTIERVRALLDAAR